MDSFAYIQITILNKYIINKLITIYNLFIFKILKTILKFHWQISRSQNSLRYLNYVNFFQIILKIWYCRAQKS